MKRINTFAAGLLLVSSFAGAQITPLSLVPKDAKSIAMGGAFTALSSGYQSLYGNPAGFALGKGSLTLANVTSWGFIKPTSDQLALVSTLLNKGNTTSDYLKAANDLITGNGLGAGAALGLGWTGAGLGLGLTAVSEEYAHGLTLLGTQFKSATQINIVVGMAVTIGPKDFNIKIGGDLRPFARIDSAVPASTLITALVTGGDPGAVILGSDAHFGLGLAADLGAIGTMGPFSAGLSVRDIAPSFAFGLTSLQNVISTGGNPTYRTTDAAQFLPNIALGLGYAPRLLPGFVDPSFYFEVQDPLRALAEKDSFWNLLHLGGEVRLLSFLFVRGGINQGWLTAGVGANLLILEIDEAFFTEELGTHPGDFPRSGLALTVKLHL